MLHSGVSSKFLLVLSVILHYGDRTIHTQKNMAEWKKSNIFINTVLVAFNEAEDRLLAQDLENKNVKDALKELKALVEPVARRHFGKDQTRHLYSVGQYFPMLQRMVCQWYKQFMRRMTTRCRVSSPWKVIMDISIPNELFLIIKDMIFVTNYGLYYHETKSKPEKFVIAFTSHVRVRNLFLQLMNSEMPKEDFLRRTYKGKDQKRIEIIVSEEKQFGMLYNSQKEIISFDFHYGFWNEHGFP